MTKPYRYIDDDQFCLSARLLPDLNNGGDTGTLSITIEGSDEPQSIHVRAVDAPVVAAGIVRAAGQQPAAVPAVVPPTDQAALLDVAAQAIRDSNGSREALEWWRQHPQLIPAHVYAAAVLAVLPVSGRAATLLWAADQYATLTDQNEAYDREQGDLGEEARIRHETVRDVVAGLRRLAGEAEQDDSEDRCGMCGHFRGAHDVDRCTVCADEDAAHSYEPTVEARQDPSPDDFTEARAAFMNIGRTPSLEGLRTELRIEGRPVLVGRYCGAEMGRMHDVPGYEHVLSIKPQLLFEYADEPPAVSSGQSGADQET